jgi:hypothetical protein
MYRDRNQTKALLARPHVEAGFDRLGFDSSEERLRQPAPGLARLLEVVVITAHTQDL